MGPAVTQTRPCFQWHRVGRMRQDRPAKEGDTHDPPMSCILACLGLPAAAQEADCTNAPDQMTMNQCAYEEWQTADAELNAVYKRAMAMLEGRRTAQLDADVRGGPEALRDAQRAWITFRDKTARPRALPCAAAAPNRWSWSMLPVAGSPGNGSPTFTGMLEDLLGARLSPVSSASLRAKRGAFSRAVTDRQIIDLALAVARQPRRSQNGAQIAAVRPPARQSQVKQVGVTLAIHHRLDDPVQHLHLAQRVLGALAV